MRPSSTPSYATAAALLLCMVAATAATRKLSQPCIECQYCSTDNCYSHCQKSCTVSSPPPSPAVATNDCEGFGRVAAATVAASACDTALASALTLHDISVNHTDQLQPYISIHTHIYMLI